jgi:hypothetical protein
MRTPHEQSSGDDGLDGFETRPTRRGGAGGPARFRLSRSFVRHYRQLAVIGSLVFATLVCVGLFVMRMAHTRDFTYIGLPWNLFLAWIPAISALVAYNSAKQRSWLSWLVVPAGAFFWLLFLPNAPYLVIRPADGRSLRLDGVVPGVGVAGADAGGDPQGGGRGDQLAVRAGGSGAERLRHLPGALPALE